MSCLPQVHQEGWHPQLRPQLERGSEKRETSEGRLRYYQKKEMETHSVPHRETEKACCSGCCVPELQGEQGGKAESCQEKEDDREACRIHHEES